MRKPEDPRKGLAAAYLRALERAKAWYVRADCLLHELIESMRPGDTVALGKGRVAELVDNFFGKNKAWKAAGINRFDLKEKAA
jgi:hypothetical protein